MCAAADRLRGVVVTLVEAVGLGVLQGVTEFLPISSSGHLALAESWLGRSSEAPLLFNVIVHLGTLVAIAVVMRERLFALIGSAFALLDGQKRSQGVSVEQRWLLLIVVASLPTAAIGLALRDLVGEMTLRPAWVGAGLLATAGLLALSHRLGSGGRDRAALGIWDAALIGLAQGIGVLPGVSRSGSTITAALARRVRGDVAVEFSVLISIPAVLGANLLEFRDADPSALAAEGGALLLGFISAAITGVLALKALQWVVVRQRLFPFALYCAALGAGAIALG